ncbi:hypothetical protein ABW20_dc0105792 [Dactylellina cionopaga]|nr:hypothetical protein ABW20_dc0105792 [Dactylellina cionopaga]
MPSAKLPTFTLAQIAAKHSSKKSCYVTLGVKVYDLTDFLPDHPGGDDLILDYAGKDISEIIVDPSSHVHSESAYEILEDSLVGFLSQEDAKKIASSIPVSESSVNLPTSNGSTAAKNVASAVVHPDPASNAPNPLTGMSSAEELSVETDLAADYKVHKFIDLNKPMLMQVFRGNFSKDFYLKQVHRPRHYKGGESAPLFGNFLEPLSKTPWWAIPIIWLPCISYGLYRSNEGLPTQTVATYFGSGLVIWTFIEYFLHRFLFHLDGYVSLSGSLLTDLRLMNFY